jgi:hypothetical protein
MKYWAGTKTQVDTSFKGLSTHVRFCVRFHARFACKPDSDPIISLFMINIYSLTLALYFSHAH